MPEARIRFAELDCWDLDDHAAEDFNRLLPQLSRSASSVDADWLQYALEKGTRFFVAYDGEHIISVVLLIPMVGLVGQKDWIEDVVTDEAYRGQGIAKRLMEMAHEASEAGVAKSVNLTSNPDRVEARRLYQDHFGYEIRQTGVFRRTHDRS
jgi:ribosomal protein S18 acetylase RimI-like enzyme